MYESVEQYIIILNQLVTAHLPGVVMISLRRSFTTIIAAAGLLVTGASIAEPVTFTKDAPLRAEARFDAAPVAQVTKGTVGDASTKQGAWINIKTPAGAGWALTTDISFGTGASSGSAGASVGNIFGRSHPTRATSTIGIRGFDKETIGNAFEEGAAVSSQQLALLDSYVVDKEGGQSFASSKGLSASSISY